MNVNEIEEHMRSENWLLYLIAIVSYALRITQAIRTHSIQDRPGNFKFRPLGLDGSGWKTYTLTVQLTPTATPELMAKHWPATPEENLERLNDCGITVATNIPACNRCGSKSIPT
jgi:hypothetical protein